MYANAKDMNSKTARQLHADNIQSAPSGYIAARALDDPDSGSISGGIDRAQRIASQLAVLADHASSLSDRLTGNGGLSEGDQNASNQPVAGYSDALHLALSRQEMIIQRLRSAMDEIERRIG